MSIGQKTEVVSNDYQILSGPFRGVVLSQTCAILVWWHISLLVPTIAFKYLYLRKMSFTTGLGGVLESMGSGVDRYFNLLLLATVDILEVSLMVGVLFVVGRLLLRIPPKCLMSASVFLCLIIMGANHYSVLQVANLLTVDTLVISVLWAKENPHILWQPMDALTISGLVLGLLWSSFFALLPSPPVRFRGLLLNFRERSSSLLLTTIVVGSLLGCLSITRMNADFPLLLRGYWSSMFISFFKLDKLVLPPSQLPPLPTIKTDYHRLAYPEGTGPTPSWLAVLPSDKLTLRHIVIVALETAPRKYYPLIDNPGLPVFFEMSKRAIVSNNHYATSPYTWWNHASIVTGTYLMQKGKGIFDYSDFNADSLVSILARQGYTGTFVDPFKIGWAKNTGVWKNLGFTNLLDSENDPIPFDGSSYAVTVDKERQAISRALGAILDAERGKRKAVVMIASAIGHYPWPAKPGQEGRPNKEKLYGIAELFDSLMGEFLQSLQEQGLEDQVLIVVTGDHGFRTRDEFESLGEEIEHGDAAFNVPFLLYAPGLLKSQVRLPYVTSHVDIAPTLLALMGIKEDSSWLHHGSNMLDQRLRDRVTFMMNTNLSPVSGFHWKGCHYTLNELTGQTQVRGRTSHLDAQSIEASRCGQSAGVLSESAVRSVLEAATGQFQIASVYFQNRPLVDAN